MRAVFGNSSAERFDDAGIDVEEIITGHTGLSGDTSRDYNNIRSLQSFSPMLFTRIPTHLRSGVDVANIGGNTGGASDIVEGELRDERVELHEQSERLADPTGGAQNGDLALRDRVR